MSEVGPVGFSFAESSDETRERHLKQAYSRFAGPDYYTVLSWIHQFMKPKTYVEIGVRHGASLSLALPGTVSVGIDPDPRITFCLSSKNHLFRMTSDEFFRDHSSEQTLGAARCELAFIDGLHLFEQALRDFINLERWAASGSLIMLHDCLPLDDVTSTRVRATQFYSGDAWKVVAALDSYRTDLRVAIIPTPPTGLCLVGNLNPSSEVLTCRYAEIVAAFRDQRWSDSACRPEFLSRAIRNERTAVETCLQQLLSGAARR